MPDPIAILILAAGVGSRMRSKRAKVLHSAGGKTLVEHCVQTALELSRGQSEAAIFVVVGHQADAVMEAARRASPEIRFIRQANPKGGTGDAVRSGRRKLQTAAPRLVVFCGDTPLLRANTLRGLLKFHARAKAAATVLTVDSDDPADYGRIVRGADGDISAIVEKKTASPDQLKLREINTGVYCFQTQPLFAALAKVGKDNTSGECYLTDVIAILKQQGQKVTAHKMTDPAELIGINTRADLAQVDALMRSRKARQLMVAGVTILRPESVQIDSGVQVGSDTVIEPGVTLAGRTRIGADRSEERRVGKECRL